VSWVRNRIDKIRYLWRMALEENADPHKFAVAVAVGVVVSASPVPPVLGLRSAAALGGAGITKCSKLTAWLASHVFVGPLWVLAVMIEVRLGSFILQRPPPVWGHSAAERLEAARHALAAWWIGGIPFSLLSGVLAYYITRPIARRYMERRARRKAIADAELAATLGESPARERVTAD
jgi:uncharacterized protein (DUF2062 family)